jgi:hypothetical protein
MKAGLRNYGGAAEALRTAETAEKDQKRGTAGTSGKAVLT